MPNKGNKCCCCPACLISVGQCCLCAPEHLCVRVIPSYGECCFFDTVRATWDSATESYLANVCGIDVELYYGSDGMGGCRLFLRSECLGIGEGEEDFVAIVCNELPNLDVTFGSYDTENCVIDCGTVDLNVTAETYFQPDFCTGCLCVPECICLIAELWENPVQAIPSCRAVKVACLTEGDDEYHWQFVVESDDWSATELGSVMFCEEHNDPITIDVYLRPNSYTGQCELVVESDDIVLDDPCESSTPPAGDDNPKLQVDCPDEFGIYLCNVQIGGHLLTLSIRPAECGLCPELVNCCGVEIPKTLYATIVNTNVDCASREGEQVELTYLEGTTPPEWEGFGLNNEQFLLQCQETVLCPQVGDECCTTFRLASPIPGGCADSGCSSDPLYLVFTSAGAGNAQCDNPVSADFDVIVTL